MTVNIIMEQLENYKFLELYLVFKIKQHYFVT